MVKQNKTKLNNELHTEMEQLHIMDTYHPFP